MASEIKSKNSVKVETSTSKSLRQNFKRHCKSLNVSVSQRLRDLMQKDLKKN